MLVASKVPNQDFAIFEEIRTREEPEGICKMLFLYFTFKSINFQGKLLQCLCYLVYLLRNTYVGEYNVFVVCEYSSLKEGRPRKKEARRNR